MRSAGEPQSGRQFHNLQFGQYAALQLGRYAEAKRQAEIALDQYDENLRTIAKGGLSKDDVDELRYLDFEAVGMTAEYMLSSGDYSLAPRLPTSPSTPVVDVVAQHARAMAAIALNDTTAMAAAETTARTLLNDLPKKGLVALVAPVAANELSSIAHARHDDATAFRAMDAAVAAEDAQPRRLQPTFPPIPAHELYGRMLLDAGKYDAAAAQFAAALRLFPNRALATLGAARASRGACDRVAAARYAASFAAVWSNADRPPRTR